MKTRLRAVVLTAAIAAAGTLGATPVGAEQPSYYCENIQPQAYPDLRNFLTHSKKIAEFAEATGIYNCEPV